MAVSPNRERLLAEFKVEGRELVHHDSADLQAAKTAVSSHDDRRHSKAQNLRSISEETAKLHGQLSGSDTGSMKLSATAFNKSAQRTRDQEEERNSQRKVDTDLWAMLINEEIARLNLELQNLAGDLRGKYGDDFVNAMAETYLSDKEREGLVTDEDKLKALADKMLDKDGNIKPEYANTPEADYIYKWNKRQNLNKATAQINAGLTLSADVKGPVTEVIGEAGEKALNNENLKQNEEAVSIVENTVAESQDRKRNTSMDFM